MTLYEALFLMDADSKPEAGHEEHLQEILKRAGAELVSMDKWGERKLAFPVGGKKRGLYFLAHFNAPGTAVAEIRRAAAISEFILREMILVDEDGAVKARVDALLGGTPAEAAHA